MNYRKLKLVGFGLTVLACGLFMGTQHQRVFADAAAINPNSVSSASATWVDKAHITVTIGTTTISFYDDNIGDQTYKYEAQNYSPCSGTITADLKNPSTASLKLKIIPSGSSGATCQTSSANGEKGNLTIGNTPNAQGAYVFKDSSHTQIIRADGTGNGKDKWTFTKSSFTNSANEAIYTRDSDKGADGCRDLMEVSADNTEETLWVLTTHNNGKKVSSYSGLAAQLGISGSDTSCHVMSSYPDGIDNDTDDQGDDSATTFQATRPLGSYVSASTDSSSSSTDSDTTDGSDCGAKSFNWIVCPVTTGLEDVAGQLDKLITSEMSIKTSQIFGDGSSAQGYYAAWNTFRILGTAILVIAGLVMVASQALGFEILDAYTIRKILPRLLVAIIGMSLSWPLLKFVLLFFNTLGQDTMQLIYAPFSSIPNHSQLTGGITSYLVLLTTAGLFAAELGPVLFPIFAAGVLTLLVAFLIIIIRAVAVSLLVILAPFAIACYVLPNTAKVWNLWRDNFLGLMVMFPIVMALIASGHVFALVAGSGNSVQQIVGLVAYFIGYFLILFAFRAATGLISTITGMVNDRSKGAFDRLRGARQNIVKQQHQRHMNEQSDFSKSKLGGAYRRLGSLSTPNSGALSVSGKGRSDYAELRRTHLAALSAETLKNDNGRAAGDDDATALAVEHGMTRSNFLEQYQTRTGKDAPAARAALALVERGFGAQIGTDAMQVAAFKARAASSTAYNAVPQNGETEEQAGNRAAQQRFNEGAALLNAGLMTEADLTAAGKGNRARVDINGAGFSTQMKAFRAAAASQKSGGPGMTTSEAQQYLDATLDEAEPGDILAGNTRTISSLAPAMTRKLDRAIKSRDAAVASGNETSFITADRDVGRALGQIAGIQDNLNRTSPQKAGMFADLVNSQVFTHQDGKSTTVRRMIEEAVNQPTDRQGGHVFLDVRKEYANARTAVANGALVPPPADDADTHP